jgi:hypothetical protein
MKTTPFFKSAKTLAALCAASAVILSCSRDNPKPVNETEVITRVTLTFTNPDGIGNAVIYNVPPEGGDPIIPSVALKNGVTYNVTVTFEDASNPGNVKDITEEVIAEADEHYIFYQVENASLEITNADSDTEDSNGHPIGVKTVWTPTGIVDGNVIVYLIHEPQTKTGTIRDDFGGEDDANVMFNVDLSN